MQFPEEKIGLNGPSEMEIENGFWIAAKLKWLVYTITMVTLNYLIQSGKNLFFKLGPTSLGSCGSLNVCREKGMTPDLVI